MPHSEQSHAQFKSYIFLISLSTLALCAFAANSILCRLALASSSIEPYLFTSVRLASGALMLALLVVVRGMVTSGGPSCSFRESFSAGSWYGAVCLVVYAVGFSLAYVNMDAASGALVLFTCVQLTILGVSWFLGRRFSALEWLGIILSVFGFVVLMAPRERWFGGEVEAVSLGVSQLGPVLLMMSAGIAWGFYTLHGRGSRDPLADTTGNFLRSVPFVVLLFVMAFLTREHYSAKGVVLAVCSGALASGAGYALWYYVVRQLSTLLSALLQLSVPLIAALGAWIGMGEKVGAVFYFSALCIGLGISCVLLAGRRVKPSEV